MNENASVTLLFLDTQISINNIRYSSCHGSLYARIKKSVFRSMQFKKLTFSQERINCRGNLNSQNRNINCLPHTLIHTEYARINSKTQIRDPMIQYDFKIQEWRLFLKTRYLVYITIAVPGGRQQDRCTSVEVSNDLVLEPLGL